MDPPRLRLHDGTLEARILRSAPSFEPAPSAQDELWRRLQIATAVGIAAGAGAEAAAAGAPEIAAKVTGKAAWLCIVKWGAVLAVGIPAVGVATQVMMQRRSTPPHPTVHVVAPSPPVATGAPGARIDIAPPAATGPREIPAAPEAIPVVRRAPAATSPRAVHAARPIEPTDAEARSTLGAESALLGAARAKLTSGNSRGALDDVARLRAQFPHGRLAQEREVVAVDALAALGDRPGARARALTFLDQFPASPYAARIRQSLEP
jgi:hypothetical protein